MTNQHSLTPPTELVRQWSVSSPIQYSEELWAYELFIARQAVRWCTYQVLEAVEEEIITQGWFADSTHRRAQLRAALRPKPLSLKEQALDALGPEPRPETGPTGDTILNHGSIERHRSVRRALEALPND